MEPMVDPEGEAEGREAAKTGGGGRCTSGSQMGEEEW